LGEGRGRRGEKNFGRPQTCPQKKKEGRTGVLTKISVGVWKKEEGGRRETWFCSKRYEQRPY